MLALPDQKDIEFIFQKAGIVLAFLIFKPESFINNQKPGGLQKALKTPNAQVQDLLEEIHTINDSS